MPKYKIIQLVVFGTIFSNIIFAQSKIKKTFYNNGKTESINHKMPDNSTQILTFYLNGNPKKEINIKDNKLYGRQITYDSLGRKITESFVIGVDNISYRLICDSVTNDNLVDVISSKEINYFLNGKKKSEGYIINACKAGLWTYYNDNATLKTTTFYKTLTSKE